MGMPTGGPAQFGLDYLRLQAREREQLLDVGPSMTVTAVQRRTTSRHAGGKPGVAGGPHAGVAAKRANKATAIRVHVPSAQKGPPPSLSLQAARPVVGHL